MTKMEFFIFLLLEEWRRLVAVLDEVVYGFTLQGSDCSEVLHADRPGLSSARAALTLHRPQFTLRITATHAFGPPLGEGEVLEILE